MQRDAPRSEAKAGAKEDDTGGDNTVHRFAESPSFLATSVSHLRSAIDMMPNESKEGFLEAMKTAPELVQRESDPVWFLRREDFNPWAAARRLARYWEGRKEVFGERWLLPLTMDSGGALQDDALEVLRKGFIAASNVPSQGPVIFMDHSQQRGVTASTRTQVCFAVIRVIATCTDSQTRGVTFIETVTPNWEIFQGLSTERLRESRLAYTLLRDVFPVRSRRILHVELEAGEKGSLLTAFQTCQMKVLSAVLGIQLLQPLSVREYSETAQQLEDCHGISRKCVPISYGGLWTFDTFLEWEAITREAGTASVKAFLLAPELRMMAASNRLEVVGNAESEDNGESETVRAKAANAFYARRSYQKKILKQSQKKEEAQRLRTENTALVNENVRLQTLLYQAGQTVAMVERYEPYQYGHRG